VLAVVLALLSAALFGAMTVALRFGSREGRRPDAELGALVTAAAAAILAYLLVTRGRSLAGDARRIEWKPFAVSELSFGLSYMCLFAAHYRAKVTVVSPLVATESLWA
jgi:uncharacterized membrane protein